MRFLFVTENSIKGFGGGSLGGRKYCDAILNYCRENDHEFKVISLDEDMENHFPLEIYKNRKIDIQARLEGHSTYMFCVLKNHRKELTAYKPDVVFLGRTRLGFLAKFFKKNIPGVKIVTFVDNVEWDYVDSYFSNKTGLKGKAEKLLEKSVVRSDETDAIFYSDKLVYLTRRDWKRMQELYHYEDKEPTYLPICLPDIQTLSLQSDKKNIVFIGSLNYAGNILAVEDLVKNIWLPNFAKSSDMHLIIAGSHPTDYVRQLASSASNISLIKNFDKVQDIVPMNSLMVAPISKGAGMKVKVAETLSMGLMIAASDEALVGYEEAIESDKLHGIVRANSTDDYLKAIQIYKDKTVKELKEISNQNMDIFNQFYGFNRSRETVKSIMGRFAH